MKKAAPEGAASIRSSDGRWLESRLGAQLEVAAENARRGPGGVVVVAAIGGRVVGRPDAEQVVDVDIKLDVLRRLNA